MRALMADNDILGQMQVLVFLLESEEWRDLWSSLGLGIRTFADLAFGPSVADADLWHACQKEQIVLITGNRNKAGSDSLEATIQTFGTPASLPVFTLADPKQVLASRDYANQVVARFLEYLMEIDNVRGAGRLWLP